MNVLVDRERMVFLYAHESRKALNDIMWIECRGAATCLVACEPECFTGFTTFELKLLYKHTTGRDHSGLSHEQLAQVCCDLALRVSPLECNVYELATAASAIDPEDDRSYRYMKGSSKPVPQPNLFVPTGLRTPCDELEEQAARTALRRSAVAWPWGPNRTLANTSTATRAEKGPSAPTAPRGGTREVIWATANRMWEEAGKPTDVKVVLNLRKRMMDELEKQGVKRTSSSNELGNWQKFHLK